MRARGSPPSAKTITIVCANPETLDGLEGYLRSVGFAAHGSRRLDDCVARTNGATIAVLLFPDDFAWEAVIATLAELAATRSKALRVLVTSSPKTYQRLLDGPAKAVVIARPVWGWTILDTIRAHLDEGGDR
jgi:hypothetical protein